MQLKSLLLFAIFSFFLFSCDSGIKFNNPNDQHNADHSDSGDTEEETSDNTADTAQENDDSDLINSVDDSADTVQDDAEKSDDDNNSAPDNGDGYTDVTEPDDTNDIDFLQYDDTDIITDDDSDNNMSDDDTDIPDSDNDSENDTQQCTEISVNWDSLVKSNRTYYADVDFGNTSYTGTLFMEFYQNNDGSVLSGTYDLGSANNKNYSTCIECIRVESNNNKVYFQQNGTLTITKATSDNCLTGILSAKLVEVEIDLNNFISTPVLNGECIEIESELFDYQPPVQLPKIICTGQTQCYAASGAMSCPTSETANFFGQDAQYRSKCAAQSFTSFTNVVLDNNTGLTWEKSPSEENYTWENAGNHCNDLNSSSYGGKSDWRVPNPLELQTIVNISTYKPATSSNFTGIPTGADDFLWTSKEYSFDTSYAGAFNPYYGGYSYGKLKTNAYKVLCVSGDELVAMTSSDFTTSSDGKIVTDNRTGLMWQKEYVEDKTWQEALKYCADSIYAGYSDWCLPNKNELASLLNHDKIVAPYSDFPDMPSNWFWSSSTRVIDTYYAWSVNFNNGSINNGSNKGSKTYVRCVR